MMGMPWGPVNLGNFGNREFWTSVFKSTDKNQFGAGNIEEYYEISLSSPSNIKNDDQLCLACTVYFMVGEQMQLNFTINVKV
uniref:Uncharacterized protein n=1 Tax=Romanomermis culicivorax TaxID=13658 RepID=A0A915HLR6_ROMCU